MTNDLDRRKNRLLAAAGGIAALESAGKARLAKWKLQAPGEKGTLSGNNVINLDGGAIARAINEYRIGPEEEEKQEENCKRERRKRPWWF